MRRAITLALVLLATGCGFFSRSKSNFYSLDTIPGTARANVTGLPVAIDTVELPPGFDRSDVVVRKAGNQLDIRSTDQWSASMEPMFLHALAFDLASRLPEGMVILPGQVRPAGAMRGIDVVVEDFAAGPENAVILDSRWIVRESGRAPVTHHEQIRLELASLDSAAVASGYSGALAELADRIVAGLAR
jgi:uncharacterized lipoprotein YmbA